MRIQLAAVALALGLWGGLPTMGQAQAVPPPCPANSLQAFTVAPTTPTVVQEQSIGLAGTVTPNTGVGPCLVHFDVYLLTPGASFEQGPSGEIQTGRILTGYYSTDFSVGPGITSYTVDVDQPPNVPIPANTYTLRVRATTSEYVCLTGCPGVDVTATSYIPSGSLTVLPGDASEGETASSAPSPSPSPMPPGQVKKCEVLVRVNGSTQEWITKPLSFCKSPSEDRQ